MTVEKVAEIWDKLSDKASHNEGTPKQLYLKAVKAVHQLPSKDDQEDMMDNLHTYYLMNNGKLYRRADVESKFYPADDAGICDDFYDLADTII